VAACRARRGRTAASPGIRRGVEGTSESEIQAPRRFVQIPVALKLHPERGFVAEVARQPDRRVGRDAAVTADQLVDASARDASDVASACWVMPSGFKNRVSRK